MGVGVVAIGLLSRARESQSGAFRVLTVVVVVAGGQREDESGRRECKKIIRHLRINKGQSFV